MPCKCAGHEEGLRPSGRSGRDKGRRNAELHGKYSARHLRVKAAESERRARAPRVRREKSGGERAAGAIDDAVRKRRER